MSYDLAVIKIGDFVNEWSYLLQNRDKVVLKNIGEISVNAEMNWVFEPANNINYLTDSFGLAPFVSPEIAREIVAEEVVVEEEQFVALHPVQKKRLFLFKICRCFCFNA